ncbi:hypothetical protein CO083_04340 [Candidatus Roizmanbacteria bacterium CG_4_9_14_0_8_um_filter_34_12]|nr:MAG: hypothetical protein CO083_04340 [Candidatus Roizmanbacteria bacterium CG_4_9_14_0_8_um_filter_34_12]
MIVLVSTLILWLPFILRFSHWLGLSISESNFLYIYKHYDGPLYIIPAKSFYDPEIIKTLRVDISLIPGYYAAHLPLYSLFIRIFSYVFGYLKSMIFTNVFFTVILAGFFYYFIRFFQITKKPLLLATIFLFLPRFLVVRSVGAPESLFILLVLVSLFFFEKKNYLFAGVFGGLATMTKSPGILLFFAYLLAIGEQCLKQNNPVNIRNPIGNGLPAGRQGLPRSFDVTSGFARDDNNAKFAFNWRWFGLIFIPIGLLLVFILYYFQFGDFFAYFKSGDNIHLVFPYAIFNASKSWVGTAWLEDVLFVFFIYILTVITLRNTKHRSFFYFSLVYLIATTFVQHRDISRYSLPLWPMACIAFESFFTSKKFKIAAMILLPAIFLYAWNFFVQNVMPIGEWQPFL